MAWTPSSTTPSCASRPTHDPRAIVGQYVEVNNFGTTRVLRAFAPRLRDGGRLIVVASALGSLSYLAPVLHSRFDDLATLDDVDRAVADWRDAVQDGSAFGGPWPAFVNIPSKIGQVAAARTLAKQRRDGDLARDVLIASVCPGMMNTLTSQVWWDVSGAPTPDEAAVPLLELALKPVNPEHYGQLVRNGQVAPRSSVAVVTTCSPTTSMRSRALTSLHGRPVQDPDGPLAADPFENL